MLFDGLTVVANPRRLLREPSFRAFVAPIIDGRGAFGEGLDLEAVIMEVGHLCLPKNLSYYPHHQHYYYYHRLSVHTFDSLTGGRGIVCKQLHLNASAS